MTSRGSGRHAIERAAVKAHLHFGAAFDLPLHYVFDDMGVLDPIDVKLARRPGPHSRIGSRAPYYLVTTRMDRRFDDIFGSVPTGVDRAA